MKVEHINPFIEAVYELFGTMLQAKIERGQIGVCSGTTNPRDIMALIGLSGPARGTVALTFRTSTALAIVSKMLDQDVRVVDETVSDGVAEVVNMVAGNAKARMTSETEKPLDLSLPTVVHGNCYSVDYPSQAVWLEVPFMSELGEFSLRVTFEATSQEH